MNVLFCPYILKGSTYSSVAKGVISRPPYVFLMLMDYTCVHRNLLALFKLNGSDDIFYVLYSIEQEKADSISSHDRVTTLNNSKIRQTI